MKTYKWLWSISLILFVLVSCGPTAHIEKDKSANFSSYNTFAWTDMKDHKGVSNITEQRIKDAISEEIRNTKGWTEDKTRPDILLSYDVLVERGERTRSNPVYSNGFYRTFYNPYRGRYYNVYYPSRFLGYDNYSIPTREGTITVTMVDAKTERTVMQGWATEEIDNRNMKEEEIDRVVKAIVKKFDLATK